MGVILNANSPSPVMNMTMPLTRPLLSMGIICVKHDIHIGIPNPREAPSVNAIMHRIVVDVVPLAISDNDARLPVNIQIVRSFFCSIFL